MREPEPDLARNRRSRAPGKARAQRRAVRQSVVASRASAFLDRARNRR
jgi:hypothetical protein